MSMDRIPRYVELPELDGERCAWSLFGDDDLGTFGWITPAGALDAARSLVSGRAFGLDLPVDFAIRLSASREPVRHVIVDSALGTDDYLDGYYPQSSSQWDGFRHIRYRDHGYFRGHQREEFDSSEVLGVGRWAEHGIATRGVIVDIAAWGIRAGMDVDPAGRTLVTAEMLEAALADQGTTVNRGDILLVRTGWLSWLRGQAADAELGTVATLACIGLDPSAGMAEWLWDRGVAAIAADNPALEALPMTRDDGLLHRRLLALLGMPIGEYWDLDEVAAEAARIGKYDGLLVSSPLNIPGGVGSPCNATMML